MAKEELIQFEGLVTEILPDARYRVQLDAGHEIVAYTAGKMKKNRIKTLAGDRVTIEMSPYDLEKGRLIFRHKDERPGSSPAGGPPRGGQQRGGQFRVPGHMAGVEQAQGNFEVFPGHLAGLAGGAHGVIQPGAGIPDRVPDPVGHGRDALPAVMQQQHIEVTAGQQFPAPVAAHRDQCDTGLRAEQ